MPAKKAPAKLNPVVVAVLPFLVDGLVAALKPLVHVGLTVAEPFIVAAFAQARPYFVEATTDEDRQALHRIVDGLFEGPAAPAGSTS